MVNRLVLVSASALFVATLVVVHKMVAPIIVSHYGIRGVLVTIVLLYFAAVSLDDRY